MDRQVYLYELKYGFCKKLLRYKWTSDQFYTFVFTFFPDQQKFICIEVTSYKIHTLAGLKWPRLLSWKEYEYEWDSILMITLVSSTT